MAVMGSEVEFKACEQLSIPKPVLTLSDIEPTQRGASALREARVDLQRCRRWMPGQGLVARYPQ
jgi:hypothetical protein